LIKRYVLESLKNIGVTGTLYSIPLYMIESLADIIFRRRNANSWRIKI